MFIHWGIYSIPGLGEWTLFHDDWAKAYLTKLSSDPNLSTDKQIQYLRSIKLKKDYIIYDIAIEKVLSDLIEENKYNRMAFEYQTVFYLLSKQLDKVIENLSRLDDFDYLETPPLYEEALLMHRARTKKKTDSDSLQISPESYQRYSDFTKTWARYRGNTNAAFGELEKNYKDSYYFYYIYGPLIVPPAPVEWKYEENLLLFIRCVSNCVVANRLSGSDLYHAGQNWFHWQIQPD